MYDIQIRTGMFRQWETIAKDLTAVQALHLQNALANSGQKVKVIKK